MAKPTRLYIDASPLAEDKITGIPHFTAELVGALDRHPENGKSFRLILVIAFDKKAKLARWGYKNLAIRSLPLPMRVLNLLWKYRLLPAMDVLLGAGVYMFPNYKNWPLLRSKSLTYIHDLGYIRYPEFVQPKNLTFLQNGMKTWIGRSTRVLTGSDHAKAEITTLLGVPPVQVTRIYHGVEHEQFYPRSGADINQAKAKYGITDDYIIHVGSFEPRKNLSNLLKAYAELPQAVQSHYRLCLVGAGGWLNQQIFAEIESLQAKGVNIVRPNAYVEDDDLPALISGATLLVHPALYEGFGLPPLQAMACGVPVVVANNSSLPEVVGDAGVLCDAENISDISAKMERVLQDKTYREKLVPLGIKQASKFDWSLSADELIKCVKDVTKADE